MLKIFKQQNLIKFITLFVGIQAMYFILYTYVLYQRITLLHLLFIGILVSSYAVLLYAFRNRIWQGLMYVLLGAFYFWSLVNFANFKVFGNFLDTSLGDLSSFEGGRLDLIKNFYTLPPLYLYLLSILFFIVSVIFSVKYFRSQKEYVLEDGFQISSHKKSFQLKYGAGYVALLLMINTIGYSAIHYFETNPRDSWWSLENQVIDYGFVGHTYSRIINTIKQDSLVLAQENPFLNADGLSELEETQALYNLGIQENATIKDAGLVQGYGENPNILVVQLESVSSWAVDNVQTPMPFLQKLMQENITVKDFYPNSCETINAEFATNCSFVPNASEPISFSHKENKYECLPDILEKRHGYTTSFHHANLASFWDREILINKWGFDTTSFTPYYRQKAYDDVVLRDAINQVRNQSNPFYAYVTTFTTHSPHNDELIEYYNSRYETNIHAFEGVLSEYIQDVEIDEDTVRKYFGFLTATDVALQNLFTHLEVSGLRDNTIVMIHNDHRFYNFENDALESFYLYNKSPFVIVLPTRYKAQVAELGSHIDLAPTLLHLIEKESYEPVQHFLGKSLLAQDHNEQVINKCLDKVFYINNDVLVQGNNKTHLFNAIKLHDNVEESELMSKNLYTQYLVNLTDTVLYSDKLVP